MFCRSKRCVVDEYAVHVVDVIVMLQSGIAMSLEAVSD